MPRILIVEDDPFAGPALREVVESLGFEADLATTRIDALAMLDGDPEIGIVLLDLGLPPSPKDPKEGLSCLQEIHQRSSLIKVIVLTGQSDPASALQAVRLNAFDYLTKPVDAKALSIAVERARLFHHKHSQLCSNAQVPVYMVADASHQDVPKQIKDEGMKRLLRTVLTETRHNVSEAARRLNMTREHLYYYLKKYGIERPKNLGS